MVGPCVPGTNAALGEQQMVEQTRLLIQPNYGNRCLKMFSFKFTLFALLSELGGMRVFVNYKIKRRKNKIKQKNPCGCAKMLEDFLPPVISYKRRRDGLSMIKKQPLPSPCDPPGMEGASPKERNWLKPRLLCSSRTRVVKDWWAVMMRRGCMEMPTSSRPRHRRGDAAPRGRRERY